MNVLLAMIPAFFWGTTYAVTKLTLPDWPPLLLAALRALPAGLILLMIKPSRPKSSDWAILCRLGFINIATFFSLIFVMALTLPSTISGVGMISLPVFAMIYDWLMTKRKPSKTQASLGLLLVYLAWQLFDPTTIELNPVGLLAMLAAILCIVYGSSMTKSMGSHIHWWTILTWQLIIGGILLTLGAGIYALFDPTEYVQVIDKFHLTNGLGLTWIIVLNTALGYALYVWLLQKMTVVDFTFAGIANPVAGIVVGFLFLGESFSQKQYLLMAGMIITSLMPQMIEAARAHRLKMTNQF